MVKRKKLTQAQIRRDDKAFCRWWKLTGVAKNRRKILRREPTKANIEIVSEVYRKKGAKNLRITKIKC